MNTRREQKLKILYESIFTKFKLHFMIFESLSEVLITKSHKLQTVLKCITNKKMIFFQNLNAIINIIIN